MKNCLTILLVIFVCNSCNQNNKPHQSTKETEQHLLSFEHKWLQHEFALDTASIAPLLDSTFISIDASGISNKQMELQGIYKNISAMHSDSIFIDSFKIEEPVVNVYDNSAVIVFICHTYKKDKSKPVQKRTKFYDVWIKRNEGWKAVSSEGTVVTGN